MFNEFFIRLDVKPESWEERITLFVAYLVQSHKKSNTIKSYVSAVRGVLKDINVELNEDKFLLTSLTNACKLVNDTVTLRLPIQKGLLNLLITKLFNKYDHQHYFTTLFAAMYSSMYFGLLRIGEVTMGTHPIKACDVHTARNKKKLMFVLRTSKTHWTDSKPQIIKISSRFIGKKANNSNVTDFEYCPYGLLTDYLDLRKGYNTQNEPFFILSNGEGVTPEFARNLLKELITDAGLDPKFYNCHSLRIGRATDLRNLNISVETIKKIGRWRSNAVFEYLRC